MFRLPDAAHLFEPRPAPPSTKLKLLLLRPNSSTFWRLPVEPDRRVIAEVLGCSPASMSSHMYYDRASDAAARMFFEWPSPVDSSLNYWASKFRGINVYGQVLFMGEPATAQSIQEGFRTTDLVEEILTARLSLPKMEVVDVNSIEEVR